MDLKLAAKLSDTNCNGVNDLYNELLIEHYGIENCSTDGRTELDKDPKFNKIKKDFLNNYKNYTDAQLQQLSNEGCDVLKLIKNL